MSRTVPSMSEHIIELLGVLAERVAGRRGEEHFSTASTQQTDCDMFISLVLAGTNVIVEPDRAAETQKPNLCKVNAEASSVLEQAVRKKNDPTGSWGDLFLSIVDRLPGKT